MDQNKKNDFEYKIEKDLYKIRSNLEFGEDNDVNRNQNSNLNFTDKNSGVSNKFYMNEDDSTTKSGPSQIKPGPGDNQGFEKQPRNS